MPIKSNTDKLRAEALTRIKNPRFRKFLEQAIDGDDPRAITYALNLKQYPVSAETFFLSPDYLDLSQSLYPVVLEELLQINADHNDITEILCLGSLGAAKTHIALCTHAYQLYKLSCFKSPQRAYGLDPSTELLIVFQSLDFKAAKRLNFDRFKTMVQRSPYFQRYYPWNPNITSELHFPNMVQVLPVAGLSTGAIGLNVVSASIEEVNFMEVVEKSKKATDGDTYDQAEDLYNALASRRESRYAQSPYLPGVITLVSSPNAPGALTDRKEQEAKANSKIYVYKKTSYQIRPEQFADSGTFWVFIGDGNRQPRILENKAAADKYDDDMVREVPENFRRAFEANIHGALRDHCGVSTAARHPFFSQPRVLPAFVQRQSLFVTPDVDFVDIKCELSGDYLGVANKDKLRAVHIDASLTGDSTGFACGYVDKFKQVEVADGSVEWMPHIIVDGTLQVMPPKGDEINYEKLRKLIYMLTTEGIPVKWVSMDSYQCICGDTRIWTDRGMISAREIKRGDVVQSRIGARPVTNIWRYGSRPTLDVITRDGDVLTVTENHKLEVGRGWCQKGSRRVPIWEWVYARDIVPGDILNAWRPGVDVDGELQPLQPPTYFSRNAKAIKTPPVLVEQMAGLLGIIWGDGCIDKDGVRVTCANYSDARDVDDLLLSVFGLTTSIRNRGDYCELRCSSRSLARWLLINFGKKSERIPEILWKSPAKVQASFVGGLIAADGSIAGDDGGVSYSTKNKDWARFVREVLKRLKIQSSLTAVPLGGSGHYPTKTPHQYIVSIRGDRARIYARIPIPYVEKSSKLETFVHVKGRDLWSRVAAVAPSSADVYDFEVADDPSYVANGFVSHNSADSLQQLRRKGYTVGRRSVDRELTPYLILRRLFECRCLEIPNHTHLKKEIVALEYDKAKGKVDHLPGNSKDVADAVCGVVYTLYVQRSLWLQGGVPVEQLPNMSGQFTSI